MAEFGYDSDSDDNDSSFVFQDLSSDEDSVSDEESRCSSVTSNTNESSKPSSRRQKSRRGKRGGRNTKGNVIVWIGNLRPNCTPEQLQQHFSRFQPSIRNKPKILSPKGPQSGTYRYSMLHLCSMEKAKEVIEAMNGTNFQGRKLSVKIKERKAKSDKTSKEIQHDSHSLAIQPSSKSDDYADSTFHLSSPSDSDDNESVCSSISSLASELSSVSGESSSKSKSVKGWKRRKKKPSYSVHVFNLPPGSTSQQVIDHFACYKSDIVNKVKIVSPKAASGNPNPHTRLCFDSIDKAQEVFDKMNKTTFNKRKLVLKLQNKAKEENLVPNEEQALHARSSNAALSYSVKIENVPNGIDANDLKGLVANLHSTSCSITGKLAILTFSSLEDTMKAVEIFNSKRLHGLIASLVENEEITSLQQAKSKTPAKNQPSKSVTQRKMRLNSCPAVQGLPLNDPPIIQGLRHSISHPHKPHKMPLMSPPIMQGQPRLMSPPIMQGHPHLMGPPNIQGHPHLIGPPTIQGHPHLMGPPIIQRHPHLTSPPAQHHNPHGYAQRMPCPPPRYPQPPILPHGPPVPNTRIQPQVLSSQPSQKGNSKRRKSDDSALKSKVHETREIIVSSDLYAFVQESEMVRFEEFKMKGGCIDYRSANLTVTASSKEEIQSFVNFFENKYLQKDLVCSPSQWNGLVIVDKFGKRRMDEMIARFEENPSVKVIEKPLKLIFVGLKDAVELVYEYVFNKLNKRIEVDRSKLSILVQLEPDLPQLIKTIYDVSITGYTKGSSLIELEKVCEDADKIHSLIEEKLDNLCTGSVPMLSLPLVNAGRKFCSTNSLPVVITVDGNEITLVSSSEDVLEKAKATFTCKPYVNMIQLSRFSEKCLQFPFADRFSFDYVSCQREHEKLVFEGFDKKDVQTAKSEVLKFLQESFKKEEIVLEQSLTCTQPQLAYLSRLLQTSESDQLFKGLAGKVLLKEGKVSIVGSKEEFTETSEALIEMVPNHSSHTLEVKNGRFIKSLLETHVLMETDHIFEAIAPAGRIIVHCFDNNSPNLALVSKTLESITAGVLYFTISPKAKNIVKPILSDLEKQQRCHVDLMKLDTPRVAIHGLTHKERGEVKSAIKEYIDKSYTIVKELPSPPISGLQMKYILLKHDEELKELKKDIQCLLPYELLKKTAFQIPPDLNANFKVIGTAKAIAPLQYALESFTINFYLEKFDIPVKNVHRFPWRKRWTILKQDSHTAVFEFRIPRFEDKTSPVSFAVYGDQSDNVSQLRETIETEVIAGVTEDKLKLDVESIKQLQTAINDKKLDFNDYLVNVKCVEKDQIVFINALAIEAHAIEIVKTEIMGFLHCTLQSSEDILFPSLSCYMVFTSKKFTFYKNALSSAQKVNVNLRTFRKGKQSGISLKGNKSSLDAIMEEILAMIERMEDAMGEVEMEVVPLLQCILTTAFKATIEERLLNDYNVELSYTTKTIRQNKLLKKACFQVASDSSKVNLFLYSGSVAAQSSDVFVVSATENFQHVDPAATHVLDEGGSIIQEECDRYMIDRGNVALDVGEAVSTSPGGLGCKCIVHAVLSLWHAGVAQDKEVLYTAVFNSLSASEGHSSVAFPALGCDIKFNIPAQMCAEMSLRAVRDYYNFHTESSLTEVAFVLSTLEAQRAFLDTLSSVFPSDTILSLNAAATPSPLSKDIWLWKNDHGGFSQYDDKDCERINYEYRQNPQGVFTITIRGVQYIISLKKMIQVNILTSYPRAIKLQKAGASSKPCAQTQSTTPLVMLSETVKEKAVICIRGPKINLKSAKKTLESTLNDLLKKEQINIPSNLGPSFIDKVKTIALNYKVSYKISDQSQRRKTLLITGVKTDLAVRDIQQYIIDQQDTGEDSERVPSEWQPQSRTTELFSLQRGSLEWRKVERNFKQTMMNPISEIIRIQNIYLWEKYVEERNRIEKFKGQVNEKDLFHGTGKNDPKLIYDSEIGFDPRFCDSGMWGIANYFAVNAKYSHNYAHTNTDGQREMFLVKVITGDSYTSPPNRALRMPPIKDNTQMSLSQVRYDTVNGTTNGSQVFMSYDLQKAYPAYLIRYTYKVSTC